uniref:Apple domain-containing protein n=1 Tax=Magallana gigas TaxID=29159 RepID=A0A8W8NKT3_MAGGI
MQMCLKECEAFSLCSSINFHRKRFVCELNSHTKDENISLINDQDYVYLEISHPSNRTCGTGVTCNLQSKCIRTTFDQFVCMPVCSCAYITSVVWYFSYARHLETPVLDVQDWAVDLKDAARVIDETDMKTAERNSDVAVRQSTLLYLGVHVCSVPMIIKQ